MSAPFRDPFLERLPLVQLLLERELSHDLVRDLIRLNDQLVRHWAQYQPALPDRVASAIDALAAVSAALPSCGEGCAR
jgi:hypothetical protein